MNLVQSASASPRVTLAYAEVTTPLPLAFSDPLYVVMPDWSIDFSFAFSDWAPTHMITLPEAGDPALLARDSRGVQRLAWLGSASIVRPDPWTNVSSFANSYSNAGDAHQVASHMLDPFGFIVARGTIKGGTANTSAFQFPVGRRPAATEVFALGNASAPGAGASATVDSSGNVVVNFAVGQGTLLGLSAIRFLAEN